jgi:PAS domain S-box-containing protein
MERARILVVEDDPLILLVARNRLAGLGYEVCGTAENGEEALEAARRTLPDLILMDIQLEGDMDGIEAASRIRSEFDVPVVYATAHSNPPVLARAIISEPFGYIVKPYGEADLRGAIETALYKHGVESRLKKSEQRFRTLTESAPFGLAMVRDDGAFLYVNQRFRDIFGYDMDEALDVPKWLTLVRLDLDWDEVRSSLDAEAAEEQGVWRPISSRECAFTRKDGAEHVVAAYITPLGDGEGIMSFEDVTDRKRAESALEEARRNLEFQVRERTGELLEKTASLEQEMECRRSAEEAQREGEQRFRAVFESARECMFFKDVSGRYVQVNPCMERLLGRSAGELIGVTDEALFGPSSSHIEEVEARVLQGETVQEEHTRPVNGVATTFHDVRTPLMDGTGNIVGIIGISRDITEFRAIEPKPTGPRGPYRAQASKKILNNALLAAKRDCIVLLLGESGSGKDWLARFIHDNSARSAGPYFSVNCAAISSELAESELFGHERGAFTGAGRRKRGLLELAEGGTLLLNELGEMPPLMQSKLLTFLDTMCFTRVGGEEIVRVDARLMVATNRDLAAEVRAGAFRSDLFYRLNVFSITVPPLRERAEDIPVLVEDLLDLVVPDKRARQATKVDTAALEALCLYQWPGNIRELRNVLERAFILAEDGLITFDSLQVETKHLGRWLWATSFPPEAPFNQVVAGLKRSLIAEALERSRGKRVDAALMLGMTRDSLKKQMKTLGMMDPDNASPHR